jgi:hypothetical protein
MNRVKIIAGIFAMIPCLLFGRVGIDTTGEKVVLTGTLDASNNIITNGIIAENFSPTNYSISSPDVKSHLVGIDQEFDNKQDRIYASVDDFTYTTNSGEIAIVSYIGAGGIVDIPPIIHGLPVKTIGNDAFRNYDNLININIPDSVTNIGTFVFAFSDLFNATIGDNVVSIGSGAFGSCGNLTGVYFKGNAPNLPGAIALFDSDTNVVYYLSGNTGFGTNFGGCSTATYGPAVLPVSFTNTGIITALQITGGATNGAVWTCTNTATGAGKWSRYYSFRAVPSGFVTNYNNIVTTETWGDEQEDVGNCFDGQTYTIPVNGIWRFIIHVVWVRVSGACVFQTYAIKVNGVQKDKLNCVWNSDVAGGSGYLDTGYLYLTNGAQVAVTVYGAAGSTNKLYTSGEGVFFSGALIRELP